MRYIISLLFILLASCQDSSIKVSSSNNGLFKNHLEGLLRPGKFTASVTTYKNLSKVQKRTLDKFVTIVESNEVLQQKFGEIRQNPDSSELFKYFGLNKNDTKIVLSIFEGNTITERESLEISKHEDVVSFLGTGKLAILDSLVVHPLDTLAFFRSERLDYLSDSSLQIRRHLPLDEHLQNVFSFTGPSGIASLLALTDKYSFVLGELSKSRKTYLYLKIHQRRSTDSPFDSFYSIVID
jgi:hypothetical protein